MIFILSASIVVLLFYLHKANEEKEDKEREHSQELEKLRDFKFYPFLEKQHIHLGSLFSMIAKNFDKFRLNNQKANYISIDFFKDMGSGYSRYTRVQFNLSYSETKMSRIVISGTGDDKELKIHIIDNIEFLYNEIIKYS